MLDTLMLSRIQFAANISFHILFPTITIALAWIMVFSSGVLFVLKLSYGLICTILGQGICAYLRSWGCLWYYHEFPIWHQLAGFYGKSR